MAWSVHVYDSAGAKRTVLTPEDPISEIHWAKRGDGACLEATIVGHGLPIQPRDIILISAQGSGAGSSTNRYLGWCVEAGDARAPELTEWHFISSSRLTELANRDPVITGDDIADMAAEALAQAAGVPGIIPDDPAQFPALGFEAGARSPRLEMIADTLQALAELVPAFTAPSGGYSYDGAAYSEGDQVPAATYGLLVEPDTTAPDSLIGAGAKAFFRRVDGELERHEVTHGLAIDWQPATAETVVDSALAVVAVVPTSGAQEVHSSSPREFFYEPVVHAVEDAYGLALNAWAVIEAANLDALQAAALVGSPSSSGMNNAANAFDGNESTYSNNSASTTGHLAHEVADTTCAVRVRYSSFADLILAFEFGTAVLGIYKVRWTLDATNGEQRDAILACPPVVQFLPSTPHTLTIRVSWATERSQDFPAEVYPTDTLRIYTIEPLEPNPEVLEAVARSQLKPPPQPVAVVEIPNDLLEPQPRMVLHLKSGETIEAPVGAAEYAITRERNLTTWIRLEHELPTPLQRDRDLNRRARGQGRLQPRHPIHGGDTGFTR